jgi:hypothetical protein
MRHTARDGHVGWHASAPTQASPEGEGFMSTAVELWFGPSFAQLHPLLQALHRRGGKLGGSVEIAFGRGIAGWFGRRLARSLGVPTAPGPHRLDVDIRSADGLLHWVRRFDGGRVFASHFVPVGAHPTGWWEERSGLLRLRLGVRVQDGAWHWEHRGSRLGPLPLPRRCMPRTEASKAAVADDRYAFRVAVHVPGLGEVLRYGGTLAAEGT